MCIYVEEMKTETQQSTGLGTSSDLDACSFVDSSIIGLSNGNTRTYHGRTSIGTNVPDVTISLGRCVTESSYVSASSCLSRASPQTSSHLGTSRASKCISYLTQSCITQHTRSKVPMKRGRHTSRFRPNAAHCSVCSQCPWPERRKKQRNKREYHKEVTKKDQRIKCIIDSCDDLDSMRSSPSSSTVEIVAGEYLSKMEDKTGDLSSEADSTIEIDIGDDLCSLYDDDHDNSKELCEICRYACSASNNDQSGYCSSCRDAQESTSEWSQDGREDVMDAKGHSTLEMVDICPDLSSEWDTEDVSQDVMDIKHTCQREGALDVSHNTGYCGQKPQSPYTTAYAQTKLSVLKEDLCDQGMEEQLQSESSVEFIESSEAELGVENRSVRNIRRNSKVSLVSKILNVKSSREGKKPESNELLKNNRVEEVMTHRPKQKITQKPEVPCTFNETHTETSTMRRPQTGLPSRECRSFSHHMRPYTTASNRPRPRNIYSNSKCQMSQEVVDCFQTQVDLRLKSTVEQKSTTEIGDGSETKNLKTEKAFDDHDYCASRGILKKREGNPNDDHRPTSEILKKAYDKEKTTMYVTYTDTNTFTNCSQGSSNDGMESDKHDVADDTLNTKIMNKVSAILEMIEAPKWDKQANRKDEESKVKINEKARDERNNKDNTCSSDIGEIVSNTIELLTTLTRDEQEQMRAQLDLFYEEVERVKSLEILSNTYEIDKVEKKQKVEETIQKGKIDIIEKVKNFQKRADEMLTAVNEDQPGPSGVKNVNKQKREKSQVVKRIPTRNFCCTSNNTNNILAKAKERIKKERKKIKRKIAKLRAFVLLEIRRVPSPSPSWSDEDNSLEQIREIISSHNFSFVITFPDLNLDEQFYCPNLKFNPNLKRLKLKSKIELKVKRKFKIKKIKHTNIDLKKMRLIDARKIIASMERFHLDSLLCQLCTVKRTLNRAMAQNEDATRKVKLSIKLDEQTLQPFRLISVAKHLNKLTFEPHCYIHFKPCVYIHIHVPRVIKVNSIQFGLTPIQVNSIVSDAILLKTIALQHPTTRNNITLTYEPIRLGSFLEKWNNVCSNEKEMEISTFNSYVKINSTHNKDQNQTGHESILKTLKKELDEEPETFETRPEEILKGKLKKRDFHLNQTIDPELKTIETTETTTSRDEGKINRESNSKDCVPTKVLHKIEDHYSNKVLHKLGETNSSEALQNKSSTLKLFRCSSLNFQIPHSVCSDTTIATSSEQSESLSHTILKKSSIDILKREDSLVRNFSNICMQKVQILNTNKPIFDKSSTVSHETAEVELKNHLQNLGKEIEVSILHEGILGGKLISDTKSLPILSTKIKKDGSQDDSEEVIFNEPKLNKTSLRKRYRIRITQKNGKTEPQRKEKDTEMNSSEKIEDDKTNKFSDGTHLFSKKGKNPGHIDTKSYSFEESNTCNEGSLETFAPTLDTLSECTEVSSLAMTTLQLSSVISHVMKVFQDNISTSNITHTLKFTQELRKMSKTPPFIRKEEFFFHVPQIELNVNNKICLRPPSIQLSTKRTRGPHPVRFGPKRDQERQTEQTANEKSNFITATYTHSEMSHSLASLKPKNSMQHKSVEIFEDKRMTHYKESEVEEEKRIKAKSLLNEVTLCKEETVLNEEKLSKFKINLETILKEETLQPRTSTSLQREGSPLEKRSEGHQPGKFKLINLNITGFDLVIPSVDFGNESKDKISADEPKNQKPDSFTLNEYVQVTKEFTHNDDVFLQNVEIATREQESCAREKINISVDLANEQEAQTIGKEKSVDLSVVDNRIPVEDIQSQINLNSNQENSKVQPKKRLKNVKIQRRKLRRMKTKGEKTTEQLKELDKSPEINNGNRVLSTAEKEVQEAVESSKATEVKIKQRWNKAQRLRKSMSKKRKEILKSHDSSKDSRNQAFMWSYNKHDSALSTNFKCANFDFSCYDRIESTSTDENHKNETDENSEPLKIDCPIQPLDGIPHNSKIWPRCSISDDNVSYVSLLSDVSQPPLLNISDMSLNFNMEGLDTSNELTPELEKQVATIDNEADNIIYMDVRDLNSMKSSRVKAQDNISMHNENNEEASSNASPTGIPFNTLVKTVTFHLSPPPPVHPPDPTNSDSVTPHSQFHIPHPTHVLNPSGHVKLQSIKTFSVDSLEPSKSSIVRCSSGRRGGTPERVDPHSPVTLRARNQKTLTQDAADVTREKTLVTQDATWDGIDSCDQWLAKRKFEILNKMRRSHGAKSTGTGENKM